MLFCNIGEGGLAISQPAHAWISGQILAEWHTTLSPGLVLAAAQHDLAWLDWECAPTFDPRTGRPHLFRDVGAAVHAPMWTRGVERAFHAWGARPALMISRHGGVIYRRTERHRRHPADAVAADRFLRQQAPKEAAWATLLGLDEDVLAHDTGLIAFADTLSLVFCGELAPPLDIGVPGLGVVRVAAAEPSNPSFTLSPWPFRSKAVIFQAEARALPSGGRFADQASMRGWIADPTNCVPLRITARKLD